MITNQVEPLSLFFSSEELANRIARGELKLQQLLLKMKKHTLKWNKVLLQRKNRNRNMCVILFCVVCVTVC